ncbi:hypothetical protein ACNOYE_23390 [Nannocystaceae bacterium ST9]
MSGPQDCDPRELAATESRRPLVGSDGMARVLGLLVASSLTYTFPLPENAAVVEPAPSVGAEQLYTVDPPPERPPPAGVWSDAESESSSGTADATWTDDARLSRVRVRASKQVNARLVRRSITRQSLKFEACHQQEGGRRGKAKLELRLHFDAQGELVSIELLAGTLGNARVNRCVAAVLFGLDWQGLPSQRSVVDLDLALRMR